MPHQDPPAFPTRRSSDLNIRTSRAGLTDPRKPIGVFFMVGPSGVGKTETALALADMLYGGEQNLTVINMRSEEHTSELQSRGHLVCRLMLEKKKHRDMKN